ncbi:AAA family ATPase [Stenotrophomonas maltophilia]|nr:AAA family ATPase [Stenotrophomonas maltophilia]
MTDSTFRVADLAGAGDALRAGGERVPTWITKEAGNRRLPFEAERLQRSIDAVHAEFPQLDVSDYRRVVQAMVERKPSISADDLVDLLIREAESRVDLVAPEWEQFAARIYLRRLYKRASRNRFYDVGLKYGSYVGLQESLADRGIYSNDILRCYSKEELQQAGEMIDPERDRLFAYNGLYLLATRYLASDRSREVYELPQERWLTIALYLMQEEKPRERRMQLVGEAYWALSNLYMTVATPTLANAGKVGGQLSSCFIDTVDDSLQGIYDSNTDIARVSKHGGGVGAYLGYVRSSGAPIRGVANSSGGVVPWIKQLNNTAVSVDQLGQRKGAVADAVRLARAGLREGSKPVATFLFLGPTGVGKTELAKALAESIYGDEGALLRIDMSEYGERHTVARLVGAPPGYVGYDEGGQLTEKVRRKPYSVLLLDEIEKAHPDVYNILLQVFDDGRLTDGKGRVVDFTNTIIIATSNLGSDIIQRRLKARGAAGEEYERTKSEVMDVLRGHFRPEFLNRIDEIIVFHALGKEEIRHIVGLQLDRVARNAASQGVTLTFDQTLIDHFAEEGYKPEFGARELKRLIRSELETALAREMLGGGIGKGDHASARWDDKAERVVFERKEPPAQPAEPDKSDAANVAEAPPNGESKPKRKKKPAGGES